MRFFITRRAGFLPSKKKYEENAIRQQQVRQHDGKVSNYCVGLDGDRCDSEGKCVDTRSDGESGNKKTHSSGDVSSHEICRVQRQIGAPEGFLSLSWNFSLPIGPPHASLLRTLR